MSLLSASLENSRLLTPFVELARVCNEQCASWINRSRASQTLHTLFTSAQRFGEPFLVATSGLLLLGIAGLFTLSSVADTGIIGGITVLLMLFVILRALLGKVDLRKHLTIIDVLVLAFFASSVVSTAFSSYLHPSLIGLAKNMVFLSGYLVFRTAAQFDALRKNPLYLLLALLAILGLGESLIGFYQYKHHIAPLATWEDPSVNPELQLTRIFGTLKPGNPNLLAGFLIPCLASAMGLSLIFLRRRPFYNVLLTLFFSGSSVAIMAALVLTGSRGGYLAIVGMLASWFAIVGHLLWHDGNLKQNKGFKALWLVVLIVSVVGLGGAVMSSHQLQHRIASIGAMREDSSISYRLNVYRSVERMIADNPVVGIGPGNDTFKLVYGLYMTPGYNALGAYSVPLEVTVEQGVIGLFIFLLLLSTILLRTCLALDAGGEAETADKFLLGLLFTGILGSLIYGLFDTIWYRPSVNLPFWFFVAAFAVESERLLNSQYEHASRDH